MMPSWTKTSTLANATPASAAAMRVREWVSCSQPIGKRPKSRARSAVIRSPATDVTIRPVTSSPVSAAARTDESGSSCHRHANDAGIGIGGGIGGKDALAFHFQPDVGDRPGQRIG